LANQSGIARIVRAAVVNGDDVIHLEARNQLRELGMVVAVLVDALGHSKSVTQTAAAAVLADLIALADQLAQLRPCAYRQIFFDASFRAPRLPRRRTRLATPPAMKRRPLWRQEKATAAPPPRGAPQVGQDLDQALAAASV
jgi:hypothetical protein